MVGHVIGCPEVDVIGGGCAGHVEDGVADCGGVGQDAEGVVHGNIAQIEGNNNDESFTRRIQFLNL